MFHLRFYTNLDTCIQVATAPILLERKPYTLHVLVGSHSILDKKLIAYNKMNMTKVYLIDKKWDFIINLIGDYVIKISLDKKIKNKMDIIFDTMNIEETKHAMQRLYALPSKCKITVERNPTIARTYEKEFRKYFVIK